MTKQCSNMLKSHSNTHKMLVLEIAGVFHMHTYNLTNYEKYNSPDMYEKVTIYLQKADQLIQKKSESKMES